MPELEKMCALKVSDRLKAIDPIQGRLTALTLTTALLSYSTPFSTILVFLSTNFPTCSNTINYVVLKMS